MVHISLKQARRLALHGQLLDGRAELPEGKEGVARTIEHLGYVQIDTIAVIRRAHHHTLWTRRPDYAPDMLHQLQAKDRRLFEYWGHAASYLPIADYRYYLPHMQRFYDPQHSWIRRRWEQSRHLFEPILERIRQEGPLGSKDFAPPPGKKRSGWWDWKPAKMALELLFWQGRLMVRERRGFQRIYDLTERVLPEDVDTRMPDENGLGRFFVRRALRAYGVAREREIWDHIPGAGREPLSRALAAMLEAAEVVEVQVEEIVGEAYYALPGVLERLDLPARPLARVDLLSPFDNLVILRDRIDRLFGFEYKLESYTPAEKRKYGYHTLPILWGEGLVGRLDPKAERRQRTLILRNLVFEPGFDAWDDFLPPFAKKVAQLAQFNGCERVLLERAEPAEIGSALECLLQKVET